MGLHFPAENNGLPGLSLHALRVCDMRNMTLGFEYLTIMHGKIFLALLLLGPLATHIALADDPAPALQPSEVRLTLVDDDSTKTITELVFHTEHDFLEGALVIPIAESTTHQIRLEFGDELLGYKTPKTQTEETQGVAGSKRSFLQIELLPEVKARLKTGDLVTAKVTVTLPEGTGGTYTKKIIANLEREDLRQEVQVTNSSHVNWGNDNQVRLTLLRKSGAAPAVLDLMLSDFPAIPKAGTMGKIEMLNIAVDAKTLVVPIDPATVTGNTHQRLQHSLTLTNPANPANAKVELPQGTTIELEVGASGIVPDKTSFALTKPLSFKIDSDDCRCSGKCQGPDHIEVTPMGPHPTATVVIQHVDPTSVDWMPVLLAKEDVTLLKARKVQLCINDTGMAPYRFWETSDDVYLHHSSSPADSVFDASGFHEFFLVTCTPEVLTKGDGHFGERLKKLQATMNAEADHLDDLLPLLCLDPVLANEIDKLLRQSGLTQSEYLEDLLKRLNAAIQSAAPVLEQQQIVDTLEKKRRLFYELERDLKRNSTEGAHDPELARLHHRIIDLEEELSKESNKLTRLQAYHKWDSSGITYDVADHPLRDPVRTRQDY